MPKKPNGLQDQIDAEAKRRGITRSELLREMSPRMTTFPVRFSEEMRADLEAEAEQRGITASEVVRDRCQRAPKVHHVRGAKG